MSRLEGIPYYSRQPDEVDAKLYNLWRRAKLHFPMPVRLPLKGYQGLVMLVEENAWVCVDETLNDIPVLAWLEFEDQGRQALHLPIKCKLNYYHHAASKIRVHTLELMQEELEKRLH